MRLTDSQLSSGFIISSDINSNIQFEKIPVKIFSDYKEAEKLIATEIASLINLKKKENKVAV